jgi:SH3 domain-containing YSC84-like protein 1
LEKECKKAAKTLFSFIKPGTQGPDSIIPPDLLTKAKGLAILHVLKGGFVWSVRLGSGLVVAKLNDGSWSAPSAISVAGAGFGGQIGAELTDFVFILNTTDAVNAFSHGGNVTLGANVSVAAGPVGRNAEAAGTVANLAAIYSYSKTKGLFAGISVEGTILVERKDANRMFYHRKVGAKEILSGQVERPPAASELYRALDSRSGTNSPVSPIGGNFPYGDDWRNDEKNDSISGLNSGYKGSASYYEPPPTYSGEAGSSTSAPPIPPRIPPRNTAKALYDFKGEKPDDLSFQKGDIILILQKTSSQNDWWKGQLNGRTGDFPANYVQLQ